MAHVPKFILFDKKYTTGMAIQSYRIDIPTKKIYINSILWITTYTLDDVRPSIAKKNIWNEINKFC